MPTITNKIAIQPVSYFTGTATRAEARWVTTTLGRASASVDLHLWAETDTEVGSKVVSVPQEVYDAWVDDAEFLGHVAEAAGLTPVEPVVWIEVPDPVVEEPAVEPAPVEPVDAPVEGAPAEPAQG